jgi:ABC-type Fe3+/spermidine/putrescine transport system ATPase subunit
MPSIVLEHVSLKRGTKQVFRDFSIEIGDGEYFAIVGETGAGKTSVLNLVNGLLVPDAGRVLIDGKDVTRVPAEKRDAGMVFENYALFPHYSIMKNVEYSRRVRDLDQAATTKEAHEVLKMMLLTGRDGALPRELSGGMQQRTALARALMVGSGVLLLDDPFSALDAGLRMNLRIEIKNLARDIGTTVIHCTNDVEEAMMVCTRMAILRDGRVEQVGTPDEIYYHPRNLYVAAFMGDINIMKGTIVQVDDTHGYYSLVHGEEPRSRIFRVSIREDPPAFQDGDEVLLLIRAEHFHILPPDRKQPNHLHGKVVDKAFLGHLVRYEVSDVSCGTGHILKVQRFVNAKTHKKKYEPGSDVTISFSPSLAMLFPVPSEEELKAIGETFV